MIRLNKIFRHKNFQISLLLIIFFIAGLFLFQDYGESWDEPEYYQYADSTLKAYSISDLFSGNYDLESTLGPADLRYYGPAFLIIGKGLLALLQLVFPHVLFIDFWHLIIYLFFLLGLFFFYKIALRWTSSFPAALATLLLYSQPVVFGNSWINPKDIPFFVFFLGTIYSGLAFLDQARIFLAGFDEQKAAPKRQTSPWLRFSNKRDKLYLALGILLLVLALSLQTLSGAVKGIIASKILSVNIDQPASLFDQVFVSLVQAEDTVTTAFYAQKSASLYDHYLPLAFVLTGLYWLIYLYFHRHPQRPIQLIRSITKPVARFIGNYRQQPNKRTFLFSFLAACLFLAFTCATRVLGPLAGLLIISVWAVTFKKKSIPMILLYGLISVLGLYLLWPYLWQAPWKNLLFVVHHMSNFPTGIGVTFNGLAYDSRMLPASYFPTLLGITLTEPAILLILFGFVIYLSEIVKQKFNNPEPLILCAWFFIPFFYVLIFNPPMYDNYRHFLFILPALFLFSAFGIQWLHRKIKQNGLSLLLAFLILVPGLIVLVQLHPYQYSYYNSMVGGIQGVEGKYEIDYWLTCYRELLNKATSGEKGPIDIYVDLNPDLLTAYKPQNMTTHSINVESYPQGSLIFLPQRWQHTKLFEQYPVAYEVKVKGVALCIARRVE